MGTVLKHLKKEKEKIEGGKIIQYGHVTRKEPSR